MFARFEKIIRADYAYRKKLRAQRKSEQKEIIKAQQQRRLAEEGIKKSLLGLKRMKLDRNPTSL
jgi:hypothetical protein